MKEQTYHGVAKGTPQLKLGQTTSAKRARVWGWGVDEASLVCPGWLTKVGWQVVSGDYPERHLISANLDPWRKMAEMEAGGHGLYHMAQEAALPVWKVSKKMIDTPAEVPKPRRVKVWLQVRALRLKGPRTWLI